MWGKVSKLRAGVEQRAGVVGLGWVWIPGRPVHLKTDSYGSKMTFLAETFRDLAGPVVRSDGEVFDVSWGTNNWIIARLALMVVEEMYKRCGSVNWAPTLMDSVIKSQHINPAHYANVKERVEKADTEEK